MAEPGDGGEQQLFPTHIAIIMDGNGRWARKRGLPRIRGHRAAEKAVRDVVTYCAETPEIKILTLYTFSSENWKRPRREVDRLMALLVRMLHQERKTLTRGRVRFKVIGQKRRLSPEVRQAIRETEALTRAYDNLLVQAAISYGARAEIAEAARRLARKALKGAIAPADIDEDALADELYTAGVRDPDLLVRTAGEQRLSNFLLWQLSYSEFYFTDILWPDFRREHLMDAIEDYRRRKRKFGGLSQPS